MKFKNQLDKSTLGEITSFDRKAGGKGLGMEDGHEGPWYSSKQAGCVMGTAEGAFKVRVWAKRWSKARERPQTGQDDGDMGRAGSKREEEERR